ncbi:MAG TPA: polyketide synthase, partial [Streptosporangiaceae bacterium]|nr:polyketide synthase [Streptosporangiaceae bacterium]
MTGATAAGSPDSPARPIAVVGLACRYPDADDPAALLDLVLTGRRAFRRIPRGRLDLADYYSPDPGAEDATYSTRAALIEGWRFDPAAFGVSGAARASADPARWLALETTARALAAAGFPGGAGLPGARAGAYLGGAVSGEGAPAAALRLRWPYSRRVISEALSAAGVPANVADRVLEAASARYLAPFPPVTAGTLAGSTPASVAAGICGQFGLRGGGVTVAAAGASSLAAVATACLALAAGEVDVAVTGGVDLSIDPLDLVGLAKAGMLAIGDMRVYDEHPTGFLPGEGCGVVLLMRAADARAANLPVYAEILGWGSASACGPAAAGPEPAGAAPAGHKLAGAGPAGQLLAMRRAHEMARVDPADVQLIEGCGTGVPAGDLAELTALAELRAGARHVAALGSISANIGNTRAAAGAAGLIKAVLAIANGVLPPSTGVRTPHPMLRDGRAALRLPAAPEPWPAGVRHVGVSAVSQDGLAVHLVLRGEVGRPPASARTPQPRARSLPRAVETRPAARARSRRPGGLKGRTAPAAQNLTVPALRLPVTRSCGAYSAGPEHPRAYLLHATDQRAMVAVLTRIAAIAPWLSDAQLQDLAVQLARTAAATGPAGTAGPAAGVRIALTASGQDELAGLASEAARLLTGLTGPVLGTTPGIFADPGSGDAAAPGPGGHVALVISGQPDDLPDLPQRQLSRILAVLRWLDELGVGASAAVGHGIGELAGLVWAGCMTPADARTLTALRSAALAAPGGSAPGQLGSTIGKFGTFTFRPPRYPLVSGSTGKEVTEPEVIAEVLCAELFAARLAAGKAHVITGTAGPATTAPPAASGEDDRSPADDSPAGRSPADDSPAGRSPADDQDPLAAAVAAVAEGARLLVLTGQDQQLANAVARLGARGGPVGRARPAICIDGDPADGGSVARAAAALFAAGALARPEAL